MSAGSPFEEPVIALAVGEAGGIAPPTRAAKPPKSPIARGMNGANGDRLSQENCIRRSNEKEPEREREREKGERRKKTKKERERQRRRITKG